ncbi:MAG: phage major capsid protein [Solirubrobacteraceae bacterium]
MSTATRPKPGGVEQRTTATEPPALDGRRLHGVIPYRLESKDLGGFREVIEPGALDDADMSDLIATREHDRSKLLGRHPTTLTVEDRADGLAWSVELPQSPVGEDVRVAIERGDLRATSWRMVVGRDRWEGDVRHVEAISELRDVTVTASPAYGDHAPAEYRSTPEPPATGDPERQEATMPPESTGGTAAPETTTTEPAITGGLRVEDRTATAEPASVEHRVIDALRSVPRGENRALTTSASVSPGELATFLFDKLRASSVALRSGITVLTTDKDSVVYPALTGDVAPGWFAEAAPITPGDPTFSTVTATPRKLAHLVQMSNEVIDDSDPSIVDVLNTHLLAMLALKLDLGIFEGTGTAPEIRGLANVAGIQTVDAGVNGAQPSLDLVADAIGLLEAVNTAATAIVMGPRTFAKLRKVKDTTGAYLLAAPTAATGRQLFGVPVYVSAQLSTTEATGVAGNVGSSIYVFNAAQVVYVRRHDVELELDRSRLFNSDQSELRAKARGDLIVPNPSAVVRVTHVL